MGGQGFFFFFLGGGGGGGFFDIGKMLCPYHPTQTEHAFETMLLLLSKDILHPVV